MAESILDEVRWRPAHRHPYLGFRSPEPNCALAVAVSAEDARAMVPAPGRRRPRPDAPPRSARGHHPPARRTTDGHRAGDRAGGPPAGGPPGQGGLRRYAPPASFADGLVLARRWRLPLRIADEVLVQLPASAPPAPPAGSAARNEPNRPALETFRRFVESLDLDGFDHDDAFADGHR